MKYHIIVLSKYPPPILLIGEVSMYLLPSLVPRPPQAFRRGAAFTSEAATKSRGRGYLLPTANVWLVITVLMGAYLGLYGRRVFNTSHVVAWCDTV